MPAARGIKTCIRLVHRVDNFFQCIEHAFKTQPARIRKGIKRARERFDASLSPVTKNSLALARRRKSDDPPVRGVGLPSYKTVALEATHQAAHCGRAHLFRCCQDTQADGSSKNDYRECRKAWRG